MLLAQLLAVEEVLEQGLHLGDPSGAPHQDHLVHLPLVHLGVLQALLHGIHARAEEVQVQLLERARVRGA